MFVVFKNILLQYWKMFVMDCKRKVVCADAAVLPGGGQVWQPDDKVGARQAAPYCRLVNALIEVWSMFKNGMYRTYSLSTVGYSYS